MTDHSWCAVWRVPFIISQQDQEIIKMPISICYCHPQHEVLEVKFSILSAEKFLTSQSEWQLDLMPTHILQAINRNGADTIVTLTFKLSQWNKHDSSDRYEFESHTHNSLIHCIFLLQFVTSSRATTLPSLKTTANKNPSSSYADKHFYKLSWHSNIFFSYIQISQVQNDQFLTTYRLNMCLYCYNTLAKSYTQEHNFIIMLRNISTNFHDCLWRKIPWELFVTDGKADRHRDNYPDNLTHN